MCFLDFVGGNSYLQVNKKAARVFGPTTAIYLASLLDVLSAVRKKKKYDPETGKFKLDRKFVEAETGLTLLQQQNCDMVLKSVGVIKLYDRDNMTIYTKTYYDIISSDDSVFLDGLTKTIQAALVEFQDKINSKKVSILATFKRMYLGQYSAEVEKALDDFCEVIQERGKLNKVMMTKFLKDLNDYIGTYRGATEATIIQLIETCTVNTWSDFTWATSRSSAKSYKNSTSVALPAQKIATAVDNNLKF